MVRRSYNRQKAFNFDNAEDLCLEIEYPLSIIPSYDPSQTMVHYVAQTCNCRQLLPDSKPTLLCIRYFVTLPLQWEGEEININMPKSNKKCLFGVQKGED